jgi:hypothetical protein
MNHREQAVAEDRSGQQVALAAHRAEFAKRIKKARRVEADILRGVSSDDEHHPILFKHYRTFSDLFETATVVEDLWYYKSTDVHTWPLDEHLPGGRVRKGAGQATLNSFCSVRGAHNTVFLDVRPRKAVVDMIGERMMLSDQYRINFGIVCREGGSALVTAHYNLISGSRWLALIHADTIPGIGR